MQHIFRNSLRRLPRPSHSPQQKRPNAALAQALQEEDFHPPPPRPAPAPVLEEHPRDVVVSVLGSDRVGIIRAFTSVLTASSAHVAQSRMSLLGGDFAMIVHARLPPLADPTVLAERIEGELPGFCVQVRETLPPVVRRVEELWTVRLCARDQLGIVSAFAAVVERWGGNVVQMETETAGGQFRLNGCLNVDRVDSLAVALGDFEKRFGASVALELLGVGEGRAA